MKIGNTKARALVEAKNFLQQFGFNGFSLQHLADALGIKKPSLYEHFKSKEDLGEKLIEHYQTSFQDWIEIVSVFKPEDQIAALFEMFGKFGADSRKICPLSAMIAEFNSLPAAMKTSLPQLYELQHQWLEGLIREGQKQQIFKTNRSAKELADLVLALGFGAQLLARISGDQMKIRELKTQVLELLELKKN